MTDTGVIRFPWLGHPRTLLCLELPAVVSIGFLLSALFVHDPLVRLSLLRTGAAASSIFLGLGLLVISVRARGDRHLFHQALGGTPTVATVPFFAGATGRSLHMLRILVAALALTVAFAGYLAGLASEWFDAI